MKNLLLALFGADAVSGARAPARLGNLPLGVYTSDAYTIGSERGAKRNCDKNLHCAGISFRPPDDDDDDDDDGKWTFHTHAFVPGLLDASNATSDDEDDKQRWKTYISHKAFAFHPGRMVVRPRDVLKFEASSSWSLAEAQDYCQGHAECVGFTFPTRSTRLRGFENITFARNLMAMEPDDDDRDEWRTFVANDPGGKSSRVPAASFVLPFVEQFDEQPYRSCCDRHEIDTEPNDPPVLPDIAEVQSVDTLPRIPCNISRADFYATYERTRTPVMLVGCDAGWPARERWTRDALVTRLDNATAWRSETIGTGTMGESSWGQIVDEISAGNQFYIFDNLDKQPGKDIEGDYRTPPQFDGADLYPSDFPGDYGSRRWWCVGTRGTGTNPHMDPHTTDAWNSVVHGHKWWVLYPPAVEDADSLECDADCSIDDPTPLDWYASVGAHALRTGVAGGGATPVHVLQSPGETIYVPNGMVHSVMNMDDTVAVTANYGAPGNLQRVWKEVVEDGDEKFSKRMYYTILDAEQRRAVRGGEYWPPEDWEEERDEDEEERENGEVKVDNASILLHNLRKNWSPGTRLSGSGLSTA